MKEINDKFLAGGGDFTPMALDDATAIELAGVITGRIPRDAEGIYWHASTGHFLDKEGHYCYCAQVNPGDVNEHGYYRDPQERLVGSPGGWQNLSSMYRSGSGHYNMHGEYPWQVTSVYITSETVLWRGHKMRLIRSSS